jgi:molybdopterin converting factor small subunit
MITFLISGPLRELAGNRGEVRVDGEARTLSDALSLLWRDAPAFRDRVVTELGDVRPHLNIFVDGEHMRDGGGFATPVRDGSEIIILPALSGGSVRLPASRRRTAGQRPALPWRYATSAMTLLVAPAARRRSAGRWPAFGGARHFPCVPIHPWM